MENRFKGISISEFQERFPDDDACYEYLMKLKWEEGFVCPHCGHTKYCKAKRKYDRQCTRCQSAISLTSQTLFHKLKFPILKALYIVYYVSTNIKGISSTELSLKLDLRQKTCWLFKQKAMRAMPSSGDNKIGDKAEVNETVLGGQEKVEKGPKNNKKKLVVFAIQKKGKDIRRVSRKVIKESSSKELGGFMRTTIENTPDIKTDKWLGYAPELGGVR